MYLSFYGLSEKPFSQTPDPKFLYWNDGYRETIASLRYGIQERKGFVTMIGEAGTGKTTLLRKLLDDLGPDVVSVFLFNPNATFEEILEYTLSELGIPAASGRKLAMLQRLNDFLLAAFKEGKNTILVIDEAQDLETEVLESLRLLSNLETAKEKILQIVLAGQPELATRLAQPNLRQLKQRIAVRCRVEPLARHELADFIAARLGVAGGRPDLFAPETLDPIWGFAQGIPRLINTVCDNALLVGYALGRTTIDAPVVEEVMGDLTKLDAPIAAPAPVEEHPRATIVPSGPVSPGPEAPEARAVAAPAAEAPPSGPATGPTTTPREAPAAPATSASSGGARQRILGATPPPPRRRRGAVMVAVAAVVLLAATGLWLVGAPRALEPRVRGWLAAAGLEPDPAREQPQALGAEQRRGERPLAVPAPAVAPAEQAQQAERPPSAEPSAETAPVAGGPDARTVPPADPRLPGAGGNDVAVARRDAPPAPPLESSGEPANADRAPGAAPAGPGTASASGTAASIPEPAREAVVAARPAAAPPSLAAADRMASAERPAARDRQDLQARRAGSKAKRVVVQRGDTLMNLATREYGIANYTTLDVVRAANPGIHDVNRIIAGAELLFPDPGPSSRVIDGREGVSVLVATTPILLQAEELQRVVGSRYRMPVELEPVALGDGRNLYRVSLRQLPDKAQALAIAESLGSILKDPS
jgi:type II secretory pathway predicted ATPase ExeA/phage tail protein X